jgi:hypothetical protein
MQGHVLRRLTKNWKEKGEGYAKREAEGVRGGFPPCVAPVTEMRYAHAPRNANHEPARMARLSFGRNFEC